MPKYDVKLKKDVKDDVFINFVINIQKIITEKDATDNEKRLKDTFILLIKEAFEGLVINLGKKLEYQAQKYYEKGKNKFGKISDLESDATLSILELIFNFDLSKNNSFINYLAHNLPLKIRTLSRTKKNDDLTDTENTFSENEVGENFINNIPDTSDFIKLLDDKNNLDKIREFTEKLPEKEREAIRKLAENNEKLSDTERKAKNRGLNKIREMMGII